MDPLVTNTAQILIDRNLTACSCKLGNTPVCLSQAVEMGMASLEEL